MTYNSFQEKKKGWGGRLGGTEAKQRVAYERRGRRSAWRLVDFGLRHAP